VRDRDRFDHNRAAQEDKDRDDLAPPRWSRGARFKGVRDNDVPASPTWRTTTTLDEIPSRRDVLPGLPRRALRRRGTGGPAGWRRWIAPTRSARAGGAVPHKDYYDIYAQDCFKNWCSVLPARRAASAAGRRVGADQGEEAVHDPLMPPSKAQLRGHAETAATARAPHGRTRMTPTHQGAGAGGGGGTAATTGQRLWVLRGARRHRHRFCCLTSCADSRRRLHPARGGCLPRAASRGRTNCATRTAIRLPRMAPRTTGGRRSGRRSSPVLTNAVGWPNEQGRSLRLATTTFWCVAAVVDGSSLYSFIV
jgi:hypothetical protein